MTNAVPANPRLHGAIRAAVAAASLAVAACFGAAISFAQTPAEAVETLGFVDKGYPEFD